jgi:hypothetical protein
MNKKQAITALLVFIFISFSSVWIVYRYKTINRIKNNIHMIKNGSSQEKMSARQSLIKLGKRSNKYLIEDINKFNEFEYFLYPS